MKKKPSPWIIAIAALMSNLGVTFGLLLMNSASFVPFVPEEESDEIQIEEIIGTPQYFDFFTQNIDQLVKDLEAEKEKLSSREASIAEMEARIRAEKEEMLRMRKEIEQFRNEFTNQIVEIKDEEMKNLKTLSTTYAAISPEAAVAIFNEMDDDFVVKLLSLMPTDAVGPIFQLMANSKDNSGPLSERAARFSEMLRLTVKEGK